MKRHNFLLKQHIFEVLMLLLFPTYSYSKEQVPDRKSLENSVYVTTADKSHLFQKIPLSFNTQKEVTAFHHTN